MQEPFFAAMGVDLAVLLGQDFYRGTLNLSFAPKEAVFLSGCCRLENVLGGSACPAESFSLAPASVESAGVFYPALLYRPDPAIKPGHHHGAHVVEVISQFIPGVDYGSRVTLWFRESVMELLPAPRLRLL